jgi:hypothetical protein
MKNIDSLEQLEKIIVIIVAGTLFVMIGTFVLQSIWSLTVVDDRCFDKNKVVVDQLMRLNSVQAVRHVHSSKSVYAPQLPATDQN